MASTTGSPGFLGKFKQDFKVLTGPTRLGPSYPTLPEVNDSGETNVSGLYIKGDAAGRPLIKVGLNDGYDWINEVAPTLDQWKGENDYDVIIVGSGATGLGAATQAHNLGLKYLLLESERFANVIQNFTKGKPLFAEPLNMKQKGDVWFEECSKEELLEKWEEHRQKINLNLHEFEKVTNVKGKRGNFKVETTKSSYTGSLVLMAIGKSGNPRKAGAKGEAEHAEKVYHFLADADAYREKNIFVYGGGDVSAEAVLALCDHNNVTLCTIDEKFIFPKKRNIDAMFAKQKEGKLDIIFQSQLKEISDDTVTVSHLKSKEEKTVKADVVFEMIGAELPIGFFKKVGVRIANSWHGNWILALLITLIGFAGVSYWAYEYQNGGSMLGTVGAITLLASMVVLPFMGKKGNRFAWLSFAMTISYLIYAAKGSSPHFPFHWVGKEPINDLMSNSFFGTLVPDLIKSFKGAPSYYYSLLYTVLVLYFGLKARKRWGTDRNDSYQKKRFISIILFQVIFFVLVNMVLSFVLQENYWRGWGLYQPFPLFYNTFFWWSDNDPEMVKWFFIGFGLFLTFIFIPLFVRWHGLRFCTWICGCGGLAETLGDQWRHLAPKGEKSRKWEFMGPLIVVWAFISLIVIVYKFNMSGQNAMWASYDYIVDFWLVAVIPIGLYPFFGGKFWCRYWCPLAHYMKILSKFFGKLQIESNSKCISCTQCSTYCQVGVDVMAFARNGEAFDNTNTSCIHCGVCITVCPMDVLSFSYKDGKKSKQNDELDLLKKTKEQAA